MSFAGTLKITRGGNEYIFTVMDDQPAGVLDQLSEAERWVYESPGRLSKLDEKSSLEAAQPGDILRMRTR